MDDVTAEQVREEAARRIADRRHQLLRERREIKNLQVETAARERANERELTECEAAAKFFAISFDDGPDEAAIARVQERLQQYSMRARSLPSTSELGASYARQAAELRGELEALLERKSLAEAQPTFTLLPDPRAPPGPKPQSATTKMPRIRDIVLAQLLIAQPSGLKATPIKNYIEATYSTHLHDKTVGMTLYRLSNEGQVHRKGQTWFFGPQAGHMPPVSPENPGAGAPGQSHEAE